MPTIESYANQWRRLRATDTNSTTYPTIALTPGSNNAPSGTGDAAANTTRSVFDLVEKSIYSNPVSLSYPVNQSKPVPQAFLVQLYGAANLQTVSVLFKVWNPLIEGGNIKTIQWVDTGLCEIIGTCTSSIPGAAGGILPAAALFCDKIALVGTAGNDDVSIDIVSPDDDVSKAHAVISFKGGMLLEPVIKVSAGTGNGIFRFL